MVRTFLMILLCVNGMLIILNARTLVVNKILITKLKHKIMVLDLLLKYERHNVGLINGSTTHDVVNKTNNWPEETSH